MKKKIFLIILSSTLMFVLLLLQIGTVIGGTFLNHDFYLRISEETSIFYVFREEIRSEINESITNDDQEAPPFLFDTLEETFDEEWMKGKFLRLTGEFISSIEEGENKISEIDLLDKKEEFERKLKDKFKNDTEEVFDFEEQEFNFLEEVDFPEKIDPLGFLTEEELDKLDEAFLQLKNFRNYFFPAMVILAVVLVAIMILLDGFVNGLKWTGLSLFLSGIIFIFISSLFQGVVPLSEEILGPIAGIFLGVTISVSVIFIVTGLIFFIIALILSGIFDK